MSKFLTESKDPTVRQGTPVNAVQAERTIASGVGSSITWKAKQGGRRGNRISVEYRHDVGAVAAHLVKAGANNTLRFDARVPGDAGDAITIALLDPAAPNAALGVREYAGNLNVDLATGPGDKAQGQLTAGAGSVDVEVDAPGPGGNSYTVEAEAQAGEDAALSAGLVGSALTVALGMDKGDKAVAVVDDGGVAGGIVDVLALAPGSIWNPASVNVAPGMAEDEALSVAGAGLGGDIDVTLGMDKGDKAVAIVDDSYVGGGIVDIQAIEPGSIWNDVLVTVEDGVEDGALTVLEAGVGGGITITLGMDKGDKARASIGNPYECGPNGSDISIEVNDPGAAGNAYSVVVVDPTQPNQPITVSLYAGLLTITMQSEAGDAAAANIVTTSPAGAIAILVDTPGPDGNAYEVQVIQGGPSAALSAYLYANTLTIVLPADVYGTPIHVHADDVINEINASVGGTFTASLSSGQMSSEVGVQGPTAFSGGGLNFQTVADCATLVGIINDPYGVGGTFTATDHTGGDGALTNPEGPNAFTGGGANLAPDPAKNTASLVADAINAAALYLVEATARYTYESLPISQIEEYSFSGGGANPALDPAKNTAALVAAAINAALLYDVEATARYTYESLPISQTEDYPFSGGGANLQPDPAKNTAGLVAAAINAAEGATFTATVVYDEAVTVQGPNAFTGGGANAAVTSTGNQVAAAVDAGSALVTADVIAGNGALPVTSFAAENLHGGSDFGAGEALEVETSGNAIVVHLATEPYEGTISSTAQDIIDAVGAYHPLVTAEAVGPYTGELVVVVAAARLTGGTPSGPAALAGAIMEDVQYRYVAFEDALDRDDLDFEGHWDRIAL